MAALMSKTNLKLPHIGHIPSFTYNLRPVSEGTAHSPPKWLHIHADASLNNVMWRGFSNAGLKMFHLAQLSFPQKYLGMSKNC